MLPPINVRLTRVPFCPIMKKSVITIRGESERGKCYQLAASLFGPIHPAQKQGPLQPVRYGPAGRGVAPAAARKGLQGTRHAVSIPTREWEDLQQPYPEYLYHRERIRRLVEGGKHLLEQGHTGQRAGQDREAGGEEEYRPTILQVEADRNDATLTIYHGHEETYGDSASLELYRMPFATKAEFDLLEIIKKKVDHLIAS